MALLPTIYRRAYEAVQYRLRHVETGNLSDHCRPVSIVILLTELCSAKCVHCDIWKNHGREDSPSAEQWLRVLRDLRAWLGPVMVTISGGEALMKPFAVDLVKQGGEMGLAMELLTHGYWADQRRIEALAAANPFRITISLDGVGELHNVVRGKERFWDFTYATLMNLKRLRAERGLGYAVRLKHVIMDQNLDDTLRMAPFAAEHGFEVFFQPIEQNYNTPETVDWWRVSANWPKDTARAVANVKGLIRQKQDGLPIRNSLAQLEAMIPYFEDVEAHRIATQSHAAHESRVSCSALTSLQFQANGDVRACFGKPPMGNIKTTGIRELWEAREPVWRNGNCCLYQRCTPDELTRISLPADRALVG